MSKTNKNFILQLCLIALILGCYFAVVTLSSNAQAIEEPPPLVDIDFIDENTSDPLSIALDELLKDFYAIIYVLPASGVVIVLTSFSKHVPYLNKLKSSQLALVYMTLCYAFYIAANHGGYTEQLESAFATFEQIGYILLAATGTPVLYTAVYQGNKEANTPLIGYSKASAPPNDNIPLPE